MGSEVEEHVTKKYDIKKRLGKGVRKVILLRCRLKLKKSTTCHSLFVIRVLLYSHGNFGRFAN